MNCRIPHEQSFQSFLLRSCKVRVAALLIVVTWASIAGGQPKDVTVETVQAARRFVVPIVCPAVRSSVDDRKIQRDQGLGTGFWINRSGHFLTAAHVIQAPPCVPVVYVPLRGWAAPTRTMTDEAMFRWFQFGNCQADPNLDVAVCQTAANPFDDDGVKHGIVPGKLDRAFRFDEGTPVGFTGFPFGSLRPIASKAILAGYHIGAQHLIIDTAAWPGLSGGPVYVGTGGIIGVVLARGQGTATGLTHARPIDFIRDFLRTHKIPVEAAD